MSFEDDHLDFLQKIELAIVEIDRVSADLIDAEVQNGIEALIRVYGAEAQGKSGISLKVKGISAEVADRVRSACELGLGRTTSDAEIIQVIDQKIATKTLTEVVDCLKRIQSSIKFWNKKDGRKGYLTFVSKFM